MKRPFSRKSCLFLTVFGVVLFLTLGVRTIGINANLTWAYLLGDMALRALVATVGGLLALTTILSPQAIIELRSSANNRASANVSERVVWGLVGLAMMLFGVWAFAIQMSRILQGCPPPGC